MKSLLSALFVIVFMAQAHAAQFQNTNFGGRPGGPHNGPVRGINGGGFNGGFAGRPGFPNGGFQNRPFFPPRFQRPFPQGYAGPIFEGYPGYYPAPVPVPVPLGGQITCASEPGLTNYCSIGLPISYATVVQQFTPRACVAGYTFGITPDHLAIWVADGCQGTFIIN